LVKALIIGCGISGPVAAMALQRAGVSSVIYEAYRSGAEGAGAFLSLAANGMHALRAIACDEIVGELGFPMERMTLTSGSGRALGEVVVGNALDGTAACTIKRAELYRALRDEAERRGIDIRYGKRLIAAAADGPAVVATFDDGTSDVGSLLIGSDGLRSTVRSIIDSSSPTPRYVPVLNTGGYAYDVQIPTKPHTFEMFFGKRAFFAYSVAPSGTIYWFANPPQREEQTREQLAAISTRQWKARLIDLFKDDKTPAVRIISATDEIAPPWGNSKHPVNSGLASRSDDRYR
jgi:2-polyprenyl-6-methoxyphenol hydroxylase-like FAD-dependent oxidoreductase